MLCIHLLFWVDFEPICHPCWREPRCVYQSQCSQQDLCYLCVPQCCWRGKTAGRLLFDSDCRTESGFSRTTVPPPSPVHPRAFWNCRCRFGATDAPGTIVEVCRAWGVSLRFDACEIYCWPAKGCGFCNNTAVLSFGVSSWARIVGTSKMEALFDWTGVNDGDGGLRSNTVRIK